MRKFLSFLLVFGILMQVTGSVIQILKHSVNLNYIAATLCEKKDIPQNGCQGKCHLAKELNKQAEKDRSNPQQTSKSSFDWQTIHQQDNQIVLVQTRSVLFSDFNTEKHTLGFPDPVFHPPGC